LKPEEVAELGDDTRFGVTHPDSSSDWVLEIDDMEDAKSVSTLSEDKVGGASRTTVLSPSSSCGCGAAGASTPECDALGTESADLRRFIISALKLIPPATDSSFQLFERLSFTSRMGCVSWVSSEDAGGGVT